MGHRFFGLTPSDKEVYLEQIWALMYYMGFTYKDAYNLPIWKRRWFFERTIKELKSGTEENPAPTKAAHANPPEQRALMGLRPDAPARLRRFT